GRSRDSRRAARSRARSRCRAPRARSSRGLSGHRCPPSPKARSPARRLPPHAAPRGCSPTQLSDRPRDPSTIPAIPPRPRPKTASALLRACRSPGASGGCPRRAQRRRSVLLPLFLHRDAVVDPQIKRLRLRRAFANVGIVADEMLISAREVALSHEQRDCPAIHLRNYTNVVRVRGVQFRNVLRKETHVLMEIQKCANALAAHHLGLVLANTVQHRE